MKLEKKISLVFACRNVWLKVNKFEQIWLIWIYKLLLWNAVINIITVIIPFISLSSNQIILNRLHLHHFLTILIYATLLIQLSYLYLLFSHLNYSIQRIACSYQYLASLIGIIKQKWYAVIFKRIIWKTKLKINSII